MSDEDKKKSTQKKCDHQYIVTKRFIAGGKERATEMRCSKCLVKVEVDRLDAAEQ